MKSFLVLVDTDGSIIEVKWCEPTTLINETRGSIQDLFELANRVSIQDVITRGFFDASHVARLDSQRLNSDVTNMDIFSIKSNNGVYVCAIEKNTDPASQMSVLISRFMFLIQSNDKTMGFKSPESTRFQFEGIQLLNNELVNTKRMLEKSNAQLNLLNRELNNRLVKDPLTGLVSRYQYRSEIEYQIRQDPDKLGVFMFMDIDDFKRINDTYGHGVGDAYLIEFANRLKSILVQDSVKLRIAGDEFGWFVYGLSTVDSSDLDTYWKLIQRYILADPFIYEDRILTFSLSVGMAIYGVDTKEIYEIIDYADFAMYCSKKREKNSYSRFDFEEYKKTKL